MKSKKVGVTVYSTQYCPWCIKAKEFLHENNITFKSIDVGASQKAAKEMVKLSGQNGVPVIKIGKEMIIGFDESRIRHVLGMKKKFRLW